VNVTLIVEEIMTGEITAIVAEVAVEVSAVVKTLIEIFRCLKWEGVETFRVSSLLPRPPTTHQRREKVTSHEDGFRWFVVFSSSSSSS